jgi:uncharacterized membrane protein YGL010W
MLLLTALALALVHAMGGLVLPISAAIFVVAWIFQFVGHKIEGKKPSFFEDIQYLWVGPLFVLSRLFPKAGHPLVAPDYPVDRYAGGTLGLALPLTEC